MKTLREKAYRLLKTIGSPVERTAFDGLPTRLVVTSGAMAGLLAALTLLAVAHLGDVFVLRHYYAFIIGYIYTVFSSLGLLVIHTIIGAVASYVYLRAEEYLGSGKWLAAACFFPLFASTATFVAERLTDAAGLGMSSLAPMLRIVLTLLATLAMTCYSGSPGCRSTASRWRCMLRGSARVCRMTRFARLQIPLIPTSWSPPDRTCASAGR